MDANKLDKLRELGYKVKNTCGLCQHSNLARGSDWGTCELISYAHMKHSNSRRQLSIHRSGNCPNFKMDKNKYIILQPYQEFTDGQSTGKEV